MVRTICLRFEIIGIQIADYEGIISQHQETKIIETENEETNEKSIFTSRLFSALAPLDQPDFDCQNLPLRSGKLAAREKVAAHNNLKATTSGNSIQLDNFKENHSSAANIFAMPGLSTAHGSSNSSMKSECENS